MTPEARLDRLERIAKLFVKAGLHQRRESRDQGNKLNHLIDLQIQNEKNFAGQGGRINDLIELQKQNEERFAMLAESQASTDRRLNSLIEIVRESRNGDPTGKASFTVRIIGYDGSTDSLNAFKTRASSSLKTS